MSSSARDDDALLDALAHLTADISHGRGGADVKQLRTLAAAALRHDLAEARDVPSAGRPILGLQVEYDDDVRAAMQADLLPRDHAEERERSVVAIRRNDERERLLSGRPVEATSGLAPGERLGPFVAHGGTEVWFDLFFAVRRLQIEEAGATAPALVLTSARAPAGGGDTTVEIDAGTVWIRGDLLGAGLPAGTYVGIAVSGGALRLAGPVSVVGDTVQVGNPLEAELELTLAEGEVAPTPAGCASSGASVELPDTLIFAFGAGGTDAKGSGGKATVWEQAFEFPRSTGSWTFVASLWTVILGYEVAPDQLDAGPIAKDLVDFEGKATISAGGLGLPVVAAAPEALGEAAHAAGWWISLKALGARWYDPEPRLHELFDAWVGISGEGVVVWAADVPPLDPPVTHTFSLWGIADGGPQRLPWRLTYDRPFDFSYRCDVAAGEQLLVSGGADFPLDRPVRTNGAAVTTAADQGSLLLRRAADEVTVTLGAHAGPNPSAEQVHQLALRNALVWTTPARVVFARGALTGPQIVHAGEAQVLLGVHAWAPTLPDPYVANAAIRRPDLPRDAQPRAVLVARVSWTAPDAVAVSFEGQLGARITLSGSDPSSGDPRPAPDHGPDPQVGSTQTQQGRLTRSSAAERAWRRARAVEQQGREGRAGKAIEINGRISSIVNGYLSELVGAAPRLLLLDVSTNQDLLGVALGRGLRHDDALGVFPVSDVAVHAHVANLRVVTLPQIQWEPVRTLDTDQDIITLGWFPTPLASATDGGPTQIGALSQRLVPSTPEDALRGTYEAYSDGTRVAFRTTLPFGLVAVVGLQPSDVGPRRADRYELLRPRFPDVDAVGGLQVTAIAEGGRPDAGGVSPMFEGRMGQLINGVDLQTGAPLGLSVLGSTADPAGSVETVFNNDMAADPRVPVSRFDISGYGGSNFSEWNNPFAAFAEAAKVQFRVMVGRTALEVIKVNSVLHPWGIRVTRSVTVERRPGGGVIRRDSGWQAFTPGLFDYRYFDDAANAIVVAPYSFDAGVFRGLFDVRSIRPAPGAPFSDGGATMAPYYFDAELALEGLPKRPRALGVLGFLQTVPSGDPAPEAALRALIETQGPIGGPIDVVLDLGGSGLPFRARRIEVGVALDGPNPLFVATVRGVPRLPRTGAWSVVSRPAAGVPPGGGEAVPVAEDRGVPLIRRYPFRYPAGSAAVFTAPPLDGPPSAAGDYRLADAADLLTPAAPANDYALLQSTPTHAFLFPRPFVPSSGGPVIRTTARTALADIIARSTSKGAFPPPANTIELAPGGLHFDVGGDGSLALSSPINVVGHPTPLRIAGTTGHGSVLAYDQSTLRLELLADRWSAEFTGLRVWTDVTGLERLTGAELRIIGSTDQRPQIAELRSLILQEIEEILSYIPLVGSRGVQGPIDLGASNAKHELKLEAKVKTVIPPVSVTPIAGTDLKLTLSIRQSTGFDLSTGGTKASATFGAQLAGKVPLLTVGVASVFLIVSVKVEFSIASLSGTVTSEKLELTAFAGIGVEGQIGPFQAYAFLGIGFILSYDAVTSRTKYGGLVALEAGVDLKIVKVNIRAELKGLVYEDAGATKCDYSGSVKVEVDLFLVFSISASYTVSETAVLAP